MPLKRIRTWLVVILVVLTWFSSVHASNPWQAYESTQNQTLQKYALASPVAASKPFTITTRVLLTGVDGLIQKDAVTRSVWLAGVTNVSEHGPTLLALIWELDASSWFPAWKLYLQSDAGLLPSGASRLLLDSSKQPLSRGAYTTAFSYDPNEGFLSLRITEESSGEVVYAGDVELSGYLGALYPGVGSQGHVDRQLPIQEIRSIATYPYFVPVGTRARLVALDTQDGSTLESRLIDRRGKWAFSLSLPNRRLENRICITYDDGMTETELLSIDNTTTGDQVIPFSTAAMPAGTGELIVNYQANGDNWELGRTRLQVGTVSAKAAKLQLSKDADSEPVITGLVDVIGDGPVPAFNLGINYKISIPGDAAPLNQSWQTKEGSITLPVASLGSSIISLPFRLPLDPLKASLDGKQVFIELSLSSDLDVTFKAHSLDRIVLGDRRPLFPQVGEYTVLRGDFHIHTTFSDGELSVPERLWESYMYGYDALAITDHGSSEAFDYGRNFAGDLGLVLIKGFETGLNKREHLVVLATDDAYHIREAHRWSVEPNASTVFYQDAVRDIISHDGFIIYAHPGGKWMLPGPYDSEDEANGWTDEIQWMIDQGYLGGVESRERLPAPRRDTAFRWGLENGLTLLDVSDAHAQRDFNSAFWAPVTLLLTKDVSAEGVLDAIRNGRTLIWGSGVLRGDKGWLIPFVNAVLDFKMTTSEGQRSLRITNNGSIVLDGVMQIGNEKSGYSIKLPPMSSVDIPCDSSVDTVSIRWKNAFEAPGETLVTQHQVVRD